MSDWYDITRIIKFKNYFWKCSSCWFRYYKENSSLHAYTEALRVFNRPVEEYDFKGHDILVRCLSKNVGAVFGGESKYKLIIQVTSRQKGTQK